MKKLLTVAAALLAVSAFAQEDLNSMKQKASSQIDKKMSTLRTSKDCVNNASNMDAFKACKYDMHENMQLQKMQKMEELKVKKEAEE